MKTIHLFLFCLFISALGWSQTDSLQPIVIKTVKTVDLDDSLEDLPFSLSRKRYPNKNLQQQLSLDEYLQGIPGLFVLNRNNYSQDLRISMRGFGARSAFGIRGIKIVVDGIPETTPDGQGQIDNLALGIIDEITVLRGPSSLLYGNAAGGVIDIRTQQDFENNYVQAGITTGSFNMTNYDVQAGFRTGKASTVIAANRITTDGYRDHSGFESYGFNATTRLPLSDTDGVNFQLNYTNSPLALDAGGLTIEEVNLDRSQARARNVEFDTQEQVQQIKTGISYKKDWQDIALNSYAFYTYRDFNNKLPFENSGAVELYRNYYGHGTDISFYNELGNWNNQLQAGYAIALQEDQRLRFDNEMGDVTNQVLGQLEQYHNYGFYVIDKLQNNNWTILAGLRYDINRIGVEDRFANDGSGDSDYLNALSGSLGVNYSLGNIDLFANFSTSFETPALSELSANPDGSAGFNLDLKPQTAQNYEIGIKSSMQRFDYSVALFYIQSQDDLVPFQIEEFDGRTFYRNAGEIDRQGLELSAAYQLSTSLGFSATYTYSDFTYEDYEINGTDLSGNRLPGLPEHLASVAINYSRSRFAAQTSMDYRGELFANDSNETLVDDAFIANASVNYDFTVGNDRLSIYGGLNNFLDQDYFDNVRLNAFGNRFYEPAQGINGYLGVRYRFE
ncbi:TonB-dependent receptor family protein [Nonlabens ponticola]|uniref:TonB-dependent receptor family protein n=1 Tax=Nonlabens ponticola TaxID=2496866 RepID=UPI0019D16FC6|nr:TonB-dependent receptor [Nonlabens ponticola]